MKKGIHPKYVDTTVTCVCGNVMELGCSVDSLKVEICSNCHPFYTGTHKIIDTEGRLEKFKNKYAKATASAKK